MKFNITEFMMPSTSYSFFSNNAAENTTNEESRTNERFTFEFHPFGHAFRHAIRGALGYATASWYGMGAAAATIGGFGPMMLASALGAVVLAIPYTLLDNALTYGMKHCQSTNHHFMAFMMRALKVALSIGYAVGAAMLGATMLGMAAGPVGLCALAGVYSGVIIGGALTAFVAVALIGLAIAGIVKASDLTPPGASNDNPAEHTERTFNFAM